MGAIGNYEVVSQVFAFPGGFHEETIDAPSGKVILSGGFSPESGYEIAQVSGSYPNEDGTSWTVRANTTAQDVTLWIVCAEMGC